LAPGASAPDLTHSHRPCRQ